jgi:hypothetical protein
VSDTTWTPTDEQALVKKIATVLAKGYGTSGNKKVLDIDERVARAVLVAVGPMIAASALRDAAEVALDPVRGIPFDHEHDVAIVSAWISEYADDQIEKEAGR